MQFSKPGTACPFPGEVIVVGICNTDRTRDFTPTPSVSVKGQATMENSGGGEKFIAFLQQELIPHIEARYRTSEKRVLIGHNVCAGQDPGDLSCIHRYDG